MQITISITAPQGAVEQDLLTIDVGQEMTIADLKAVIQGDTNVSPPLQTLFYKNRQLLDDSKTLRQCEIEEDAMLGMLVEDAHGGAQIRGPGQLRPGSHAARDQANRGRTRHPDPEVIRLQALGAPEVLANIRSQNPELADAASDPARFRYVWHEMLRQQQNVEAQKQRELALLNADPFDVDAQVKIEEMIREDRVMENVQNAIDYAPEVFGRVHMLYIPVEVNDHSVKAFVDSGAQTTIMSPSCAELCGIMRLIDKRFEGMAHGVGTAKVLGRVHWAQIKIGSFFLPCSFTVMEGKSVDLLLGLDMLKRHQACIDLNKGVLVIRDEAVPFLGEADIPKDTEPLNDEPTVAGPSGMRTGAISGTVTKDSAAELEASKGKGPAAAPSSSSAAHRQPSASTFAHSTFPQESVAKLMEMGLSREQAIHFLEAANGNVDLAAGMFFN